MRVGEVAEQTGVSVRSIRHYEQAGLLPAVRRDNGYRDFDASAVERVRAIRDLLEAGFTVHEILSLADCLQDAASSVRCHDQTAALYRDKLARVEGQLRTLRQLRSRLRARLGTLATD